jgi:dTDP-4-dehydrorhamnose reductase
MKPMAWITGAGGLVGSYLVHSAPRWAPQWRVRGLTRADLDLTDHAAVASRFANEKPALILHCAAISKTNECDANPALARRVNVDATTQLADLAAAIPFLFLSSDQVFDGRQGWYVETDRINPINRYGETKAAAERLVLQNPRHTVVRLALTAGASPTGDRSFVEDMRRAVARGQRLTLFTDEFRTPIAAGTVARTVWELAIRAQAGLFHLGGADRLSRMEIGAELGRWYPDLAAAIQPGSVASYQGPARPPDLSMRCDKLQRLLSFPLSGLRDWMALRPAAQPDPWDYPPDSTR